MARFTHLPTPNELASMKDDLAFKEGEMEKARATGSGLSGGESCSYSSFPFVGATKRAIPVIRHSAVRLILWFLPLLALYCWRLPSTFLLPPPFLDLSSHNPPILAVVFLVFCSLPASLTQIFLVISV